jgi:hypothetical protein
VSLLEVDFPADQTMKILSERKMYTNILMIDLSLSQAQKEWTYFRSAVKCNTKCDGSGTGRVVKVDSNPIDEKST